MNPHNLFTSTVGADNAVRAIEKAPVDGIPVIATAMLAETSAVFGSGNIGRLAVNIVANRLLSAGAEPRYISATATIDIDTDVNVVKEVAEGMRDAAVDAEMEWASVEAVAKQSGPVKGIALSAFGVGRKMINVTSRFDCPRSGDVIITTGPVAATGAAVEGYRRGIDVLTLSDGTVLIDVMRAVYVQAPNLSGVIYPIRGIRSALNELGVEAEIDSDKVPVTDVVASACSQLGIDPLDTATADAMLLTVAPADASRVIEAVRHYPAGRYAAAIGHVK